MNLIILVCAVLSANALRGFAGKLLGRFLPQKWWTKLLCLIPGLAVGLVYLYFAGYYIMDKEANPVMAAVIALLPFAVSLVAKLICRSHFVDMD